MQLSEIAKHVNGKLSGNDLAVGCVSIDTRTLKPGDLYIGIKGRQFDGNEFIEKAVEAGAAAAIVHSGFSASVPYIEVADTRLALGELGKAWRNQVTAKLVGITGSNGKTTVKEMTAAILGVSGSTLYTQGNLNNDYGVPLTLLKLQDEHRYGVIEMGANHPGEIQYTSALTGSDVIILNNAGAAHLEGFGSLDGVARAKGEIIETLKTDGVAVLNIDDNYFSYWEKVAGNRKVITFGLAKQADVTAQSITTEIVDNQFTTGFDLMGPTGGIKVNLKLAGRHNVTNALAAAAAAIALGLTKEQIKQGLESMRPVNGRLQLLVGRSGNLIIDDTYNANATSLKAGLDVLIECQGEPWLVLGAFGELGPDSPKIHKEMGELIKSMGVVRLLAVGSDAENAVTAFGKGASFFTNQEDLINALKTELTGNETLLIKGSRLQRMENVAVALVENYRN